MSIQFRARKHSQCFCRHLVFPGDEIRWTREQGDLEGTTLECPECNSRLRAGPNHRTVTNETDDDEAQRIGVPPQGYDEQDLEEEMHPGHPGNYGDN